ncbi:MAG: AbrB/MazE/SpoVT family DNA-binding domain-containing protein [Candidatus Methylomirabilis sp.]|nr:AbrB/MazE/SpoVT family DNA-binding domain-containing protein [Deltaproteobacteria bacterium]
MAKTKYGGAAKSVTLPSKIADALKLVEGDELEFHLQNGAVLLMPRKAIPKGQAWYWTPEMQAKEREAERAIREGRVGPTLRSGEDVDAYFDALAERAKKRTRRRDA